LLAVGHNSSSDEWNFPTNANDFTTVQRKEFRFFFVSVA
jgi:hypothetical protein